MLIRYLHKLASAPLRRVALRCLAVPTRIKYTPFIKSRQHSVLIPRFQQMSPVLLPRDARAYSLSPRPEIARIPESTQRQIPLGYAVAADSLLLTRDEAYVLSSDMWQ